MRRTDTMDTQFTAAPPSVPMPAKRRRSWWWFTFKLAAGLFVFLVVALVLAWLWTCRTMDNAWTEAVKEAEADLPRWRILELEEDRPKIPDEENSALVMIALRRNRAGVSPTSVPNYDKIFEKLTPTTQLNQQQSKLIRDELAKIKKPLAEARKLKDIPRGRFPVTYTDDWIGTLVPEHQGARQIADWLQHDAMLLAEDEQYDEAVESCQAVVVAGRVFEGDPFLICHLIRVSLDHAGV